VRKRAGQLKVGWVIPTVGTFGAVREMVEISNVLCRAGHHVTIFHPEGGPVKWLPSLADCTSFSKILFRRLDVVIGVVDWEPDLYSMVLDATAPFKSICLLGFDPTEDMASALRGQTPPADKAQKILRDAIRRNLTILTDSSWQIEWLQKEAKYPNAGPSFGGINLGMFKRVERPENEKPRILYSNDPRPRKGTDIVLAAIDILKQEYGDAVEFDSYWGRRFTQDGLVGFLQRGDIFLDGHRRAGWCNPVAEAIACGAVPVCANIGAVRDFALPDRTAVVVPVDDPAAMAEGAKRLIEDKQLRETMRASGWSVISQYDYETVGANFEKFLKQRVFGDGI
jgi:glycosyltransferase involved in cell wall biosynthesis